MRVNTILFDLDGTLVDSAPSILLGLDYALKKNGLSPVVPLTTSLIGPTLQEIFNVLIGKDCGLGLDPLVKDFKEYYDINGVNNTRAYPGATELLCDLHINGYRLHLATNKRLVPTKKIINMLCWGNYFISIYGIDKYESRPFKSKAAMIEALISENKIDEKSTIYIGDRYEDVLASSSNGLSAILVDWGYGDISSQEIHHDIAIASTMNELQLLIGAHKCTHC